MSNVVDEIYQAIESADYLAHYGMPRRSGRYPWGSGENPYQHGEDFLARIETLKKSGWEETPENIMNEFGLSTTQYRTEKSLAKDERRMLEVARAKSLSEDGLSPTEIGRIMGKNESSIRSLLNSDSERRMNQAKETAEFIKKQIDEKGIIDVGTGVERELGISKEKLNQALSILESEGYELYGRSVSQVTNPGQQTILKVICPPGTEHKDIYDLNNIHTLNEYYSDDGGDTFRKFVYPKSMDSSRLKILLKDEVGPDGATGDDKDGLIEIRPGVADLSLGESKYAQVRILVDDKKYLKGMAVYSDNLPDGVDVLFNSNKTDASKALKDIKDDPDNPFGSLIKANGQSYYIDENGNKQLSLINKRADEGDWSEWKNKVPSQFLAKQSEQLARKQLGIAIADKEEEYSELSSLTNPTVKKFLMSKFADECDSAAVHLQAAALPGQKYHVMIPINTLPDNEIYAPNYENGTKLALVRYPHGGTFEIPILKVNNNNPTGNSVIGNTSIDAVGVNKRVADRLSGADFDGDTVMCIPTGGNKVKITSTAPLEGLKGFDSKQYKIPEGDTTTRRMTKKGTQLQMGIISNLITDMTLLGATEDELAAAVRHSMVVIDAEKHGLDYKQSEIDNNIAALHTKYQGSPTGGASTLLSRAKGQESVVKRQGSPRVNQKDKSWYDPSKPEGALVYLTADDAYYTEEKVNKKTGEVTTVQKVRTQKSTKMAEASDAYSLISEANTPMERAYADYANKMKSLANDARKEVLSTGKIEYSKEAKNKYSDEVKSLNDKLDEALRNAPKERAAQIRANLAVAEKAEAYKEQGKKLEKEEARKTGTQALTKARSELGSVSRKERSIKITDKEWEAIQAGAISENQLKKILANTDVDVLRQKATPRETNKLSTAKINQIKAWSQSYTNKEIAERLGISPSTVANYLKKGND